MTDLWSLTVAFCGPNASSLRLLYEGGEKAKAAYAALARPRQSAEEYDRGLAAREVDPDVEITDSYGATVTLDRNQIMVRWLTHLGSQAEGMKAEQVLNAHAQKSLQNRLANDPMLKGVVQAPQFHLKQ